MNTKMDFYDCNPSISFITPEMINLLKYLRLYTPDIRHCSVIDINPLLDRERLLIISKQVSSVECLEDQLEYMKKAKILTIHVTGNKKELLVDNTETKLIIVIGNVNNIRLTLDDSETIVYHRTFNLNDETGLIIGEEIDNLKPMYHLIKSSCPFSSIFNLSVVKESGIVFVNDTTRQSLLSGSGYTYILDPKETLNTFRDAKVVSFNNNSIYEPEIIENISIVHGKPSKFKAVIEKELRNPGDILMADMPHDTLKAFIEHPCIKSYETIIETAQDGYSFINDYNRGISPARHILVRKVSDLTLLDELCFKIDNPFTFAFIKKRDPKMYQLLRYNVISKQGNSNDDVGLTFEKLRIILSSKREQELDLFKEERYTEITEGSCPDKQFLKEYPRIDAFSNKRNSIRFSHIEQNNECMTSFIQQKKSFILNQPGNYLFENYSFLIILVQCSDVNVYIKECGLVFIKDNATNVNHIHLIGNIHTLLASKTSNVVCYFTGKHLDESFNALFCSENETDSIGMFFDEYNEASLLEQYKSTIVNGDTSEPVVSIDATKINITKIKNLYCNASKIINQSLVHIDRMIQTLL